MLSSRHIKYTVICSVCLRFWPKLHIVYWLYALSSFRSVECIGAESNGCPCRSMYQCTQYTADELQDILFHFGLHELLLLCRTEISSWSLALPQSHYHVYTNNGLVHCCCPHVRYHGSLHPDLKPLSREKCWFLCFVFYCIVHFFLTIPVVCLAWHNLKSTCKLLKPVVHTNSKPTIMSAAIFLPVPHAFN